MSNIATLAADAILGLVAKFFRIMREKEQITLSTFQQVIDSHQLRQNLGAFMRAGCPKITVTNENGEAQPATPYDLATMILRHNFISPEEIVAKYPSIVYTKDQLDSFERSLPSYEDLKWIRDNNFILVPGPNSPLSLLDIRNLNTDFFNTKTGGWYAEDKQVFSRNDKTEVRWIALRKEAILTSFNENWSQDQQVLLYGLELVPNAAEAVWCMTAYKVVRNSFLFWNACAHTSSLDSGGRRVIVGDFDEFGLAVHDYWPAYRLDGIGLASARKF